MNWKYNPKTKGSGVITCIPQEGMCPNKCEDCFFQSGRSYLEPFKENLPHIPSEELADGRVVRMNDGNDSSYMKDLVIETAKNYKDYFFNTAVPGGLEEFNAPVVLTVNPASMTDKDFYKIKYTNNLMFVRIRVNVWNIEPVVRPAIRYYSEREMPIVLTFMAYYNTPIPEDYKDHYIWKQRTTNSYYVLRQEVVNQLVEDYKYNQYVYTCGVKGQHLCKFCGNCIREYYNTKERLRGAREVKGLVDSLWDASN